MDRKSAEARLSGQPKGAFLIRESDRKFGSYVLSFNGNTGVHHFRVSAVCGDFYIGGRVFHSLTDLVTFYTLCSDLLKGERLEVPVPPPEPVDDSKKRVVAVLPYTKMPDTDELRFDRKLLIGQFFLMIFLLLVFRKEIFLLLKMIWVMDGFGVNF